MNKIYSQFVPLLKLGGNIPTMCKVVEAFPFPFPVIYLPDFARHCQFASQSAPEENNCKITVEEAADTYNNNDENINYEVGEAWKFTEDVFL